MKKTNILILIIFFSLFFFGCTAKVHREIYTPEPEPNNNTLQIYFGKEQIYTKKDIDIENTRIEIYSYRPIYSAHLDSVSYNLFFPIKIEYIGINDTPIDVKLNNKSINQNFTISYNKSTNEIVLSCLQKNTETPKKCSGFIEIYSAVKYIQDETEKTETKEKNKSEIYELITEEKTFDMTKTNELDLSVVPLNTIYLKLENETIGIRLYQTAPGITYCASWANFISFSNETTLKDFNYFKNKQVKLIWETNEDELNGKLKGLEKIYFSGSNINNDSYSTEIGISHSIRRSLVLNETLQLEYKSIKISSKDDKIKFDPPLPFKKSNSICPSMSIEKILPTIFYFEDEKYILTNIDYDKDEINIAKYGGEKIISIGEMEEIYPNVWIVLMDLDKFSEIQIENCSLWTKPAIIKIRYIHGKNRIV